MPAEHLKRPSESRQLTAASRQRRAMAEDAAERRRDRLLFGVSPTPTASSAGPTLALQSNLASIDWHGLGPKRASLSGTSAGPPRPAVSTSTAAVSTPSHRLLCRPWDCGDLLRRLASFKLSSWAQKPEIIGPAVCARKGWVNVDTDIIACEGCENHLSFSLPTSSQQQQHEVDRAAELFREQLESGHQPSCPWKGNACADSLSRFPTTPVIALIGGYNDRCDALLQLTSLPVVSGFAVDQMKLSRGPQIDRLLSQPPQTPEFLDANYRIESGISFYKAQRIISLCGWEPRLLPYTADFEDHSAQSTRNPVSKTSSRHGKRGSMMNATKTAELRYNAASALLECNYCGANVNISSFGSAVRPSRLILGSEYQESEKKQAAATLVRFISAASSIDGAAATAAAAAATAVTGTNEEQKDIPLSLNLTIAGGPPPTLSGPNTQLAAEAQGSEMGDCGAASYESHGMRDDSSIYMPPQLRTESGGGTNGDRDGDEEGKSYMDESFKRKRVTESSAADQYSLGMAVSGNAAATTTDADADADADAEVDNDLMNRNNKRACIASKPIECSKKKKRKKKDHHNHHHHHHQHHHQQQQQQQQKPQQHHEGASNSVRKRKEFPCSSSVNATDTCYQNKKENSMESVEFHPQDDDEAQRNTAASEYVEIDNEWGQVARGGFERSSGEEGEATNAAMISTGTGTGGGGGGGGGGSVDMVARMGSSGHRVPSNEADIQGGNYGAEFSEHQTESVAGEAEVVIDPGQSGEFVPESGLVCESVVPDVALGASLSTVGPGPGSSSGLAPPPPVTAASGGGGLVVEGRKGGGVVSEDGESGESGSRQKPVGQRRRQRRRIEEERTADTTNAMIVGGCSMATAGVSMDTGTTTTTTLPAVVTAKENEFDPIRRHRRYCPWVNGVVLCAANDVVLCGAAAAAGWQLTVDALDMQQNIPAGVTESESTASIFKDEASGLKKQCDGNASPKQCNGSSVH